MPSTLQTRVSLLERIRQGHAAAWDEFVHRYTPFVVRVARRARLRETQIDELAQDTWYAVFTHFSKLTAPFSREKGPFRAWLHGVIRHKILDLRRRERQQRGLSVADPVEECTIQAEIDALIDAEWNQHVLDLARRELARRLRPQTYQALDLYAFQDQPAEHVARLLGIRVDAVYLAKSRGLMQLRAIIAEIEREECEP